MKLLIIDNYDSFTYNLVYIVRQSNIEFDIFRNDKIDGKEALKYDGLLLSPGPGIPGEAGNLIDIIRICAGEVPILGICLGHQALAISFGGQLNQLVEVHHGISSSITSMEEKSSLFDEVNNPFDAGRYHSWIVNENYLPENFSVTARDDVGHIMAMEDSGQDLYGLQFHPESLMTPKGPKMIQNFISICKSRLS